MNPSNNQIIQPPPFKEVLCPLHQKKITHVCLVSTFVIKNESLVCADCMTTINKAECKLLPFAEVSNFILKFTSSKATDFYSYTVGLDKFHDTFDKQGQRDFKKLKDSIDDEFTKMERSVMREVEKLKLYILKILEEMKQQLSSTLTQSDLFLNTSTYIKNNQDYIKKFKETLNKCDTYDEFNKFYASLNPNKMLQLYYDDAEKRKKDIRNLFLKFEEASTNFFTIVNVELDRFTKNCNLKTINANPTVQINKINLPNSNKDSSASYFNESSYFTMNMVQVSNYKISQMVPIDNRKILFVKITR
jgi:ElaB/YqjD/DUF883 family membrane-anchored ribosome-binding protein